ARRSSASAGWPSSAAAAEHALSPRRVQSSSLDRTLDAKSTAGLRKEAGCPFGCLQVSPSGATARRGTPRRSRADVLWTQFSFLGVPRLDAVLRGAAVQTSCGHSSPSLGCHGSTRYSAAQPCRRPV